MDHHPRETGAGLTLPIVDRQLAGVIDPTPQRIAPTGADTIGITHLTTDAIGLILPKMVPTGGAGITLLTIDALTDTTQGITHLTTDVHVLTGVAAIGLFLGAFLLPQGGAIGLFLGAFLLLQGGDIGATLLASRQEEASRPGQGVVGGGATLQDRVGAIQGV